MIYFVIIAFIVTLFLKRNPFSFIRNISFEWPLLIVLSFAIQIFLSFYSSATRDKLEWIFILTFIGVIIGLWKNRHYSGVKWILAGAVLNLAALVLHGGVMPVDAHALQMTGQENAVFETDARHTLMENSLFWIVGDWIPVIRYVMSPGDIFVGIGIFLMIVCNSGPGVKYGEAA
ncbi:DUF5317 domain-containing protein [Falsibacillus pallidus]|uniref:Uncharacterized protein n=1 Tax=Falsibacillus pallidus TaxID=493781 RepID=A0A370GDJ1_9BACI|nr:DUF5317 domain-containing protein [Falsibacillus pallidus]RDI40043.1 hypothetical protein DFR59_11367 [Falsibacillus pallidus]